MADFSKFGTPLGDETPDFSSGGASLDFARFGEPLDADVGLGTRTADVARSVPSGAVTSVGMGLSGLGELNDVTARAIERGIRAVGLGGVADFLTETQIPWWLNPSEILRRPGNVLKQTGKDIGAPEERQNLATDVAQGVGQIGGQIVTALAGGPAVSLANLFGQGADIAADRAREEGKYGTAEGDAHIAIGSTITGLTEKMGLDAILNRVPPQIKNRVLRQLTDIGIAGGIEAAQEVVEGVMHNLSARYILDSDKPILEGLDREAMAAGGAGAIVRAMVNLATRGRSRGVQEEAAAQPAPLTPDDQASPIPSDLIAEGRKTFAMNEARGRANEILTGIGLPNVGERVSMTAPDGSAVAGTIDDAFIGAGRPATAEALYDDENTGQQVGWYDRQTGQTFPLDAPVDRGSGVNIRLDDGRIVSISTTDLTESGIRIAPILGLTGPEPVQPDLLGAPDRSGATTTYGEGFTMRGEDQPQRALPSPQDFVPEGFRPGGDFIYEDPARRAPRTVKRPSRGQQFRPTEPMATETPAGDAAASADAPIAVPADVTISDADAAPQAADRLRGERIDDEWVSFSPDSGSLNIPRSDMPQVKAEHRGALANFLKARGIEGAEETVPASSLKPTQAEFSESKVAKAKAREGGDRAILVSGDGHVLDGHHQWMASVEKGEDIRVIRLDAPIATLLEAVKEFPSVEQSDGGVSGQAATSARKVDDATFQSIWRDRKFKEAIQKAGGLPHRESSAAQDTVAGWRDGQANNVGALRAEVERALRGRDSYQPTGLNPLQAYVTAFYAARTGNPREVRVLPSEDGRFIGVEQALAELEGRSPDPAAAQPETQATPALTVEDISEKAIIVKGETKPNIDRIKSAAKGVKPLWNKSRQGWVFPKKREADVRAALADLLGGAAPQAEPTGPFDRRDTAQRSIYDRRIEDITDPAELRAYAEELRTALMTDERTGLGSNRAWLSREPKAFVASIDLDSLKYVNDHMGHDAGDRMIAAVGDALRAAGLEAYHVSGDEFYAQADSEQALREGLSRARENLRGATIEGRGLNYSAPGFSYGIGQNVEQAERALHDDKSAREAAGERAARGERPRGIAEAAPAPQRNRAASGGRAEAPATRQGGRAERSEPDVSQPQGYGEANKVFTKDAAERARELLRRKLTQLNTGIDPEIVQAGITLAGYHIEAGARKFTDYSRAMIADLGEAARPYLRSWYEGVRYYPGFNAEGMSTAAEIDAALSEQPGDARAVAETDGFNDAVADEGRDGERSDGGNLDDAAVEGSDPSVARIEEPEAADAAEGVGTAGAGDRGAGRGGEGVVSGGAVRADDAAVPEPRTQPARSGRRNRRDPAGDVGDGVRPSGRVAGGRKLKRTPDNGAVNYAAPSGALRREGGWKATAERNLDIIELVNRIEEEGRPATPEEQAKIVKFTGWGASEIRQGLFPQGSVVRNEAGERVYRPSQWGEWKDIAARAAKVLQGPALESALQSTQYAHYTSEPVIRSIWAGIERLGFTGGKVFEPGMGVGLFAVAAPKDVMAQSHYTGIELDQFTAAVARMLLPQENVIHGDFVKQSFPDGFFDLAIGNPPFANIKITEDPAYRKHRFSLHDYFFAKSIDKVRPGGLLVFVTSRYTMDKLNDKARAYLAERADLVGAIRLPQTAFKQNAGTEVVTDVLFLRKRVPGEPVGGEAWLGHDNVTINGEKSLVNEYFVRHPEMVLGAHALTGTMYSKNEYTVEPKPGDIEEHFAAAVARLPEGIYSEPISLAQKVEAVRRDFDPKAKKEGGVYVADDGEIMVVEQGSGVPLSTVENLKPADTAWLKDYVPLRDAVKQAQLDQLQDGDWEASLKALNKAYRAFVKKHGKLLAYTQSERVSREEADEGDPGAVRGKDGRWYVETTHVYRRYKNDRLMEMDIESPLVRALETLTETGEIVEGGFLKGRTLNKPARPKIEGPTDALSVSLDERGRLDLPHIAELADTTVEDAIAKLGDAIYMTPAGEWQLADEYLSGDVVTKLEEAEAAAAADPAFERNVAALTKVQPLPLTPSQIDVQPGAAWVPSDVVALFADEVLGFRTEIEYQPATATWTVSAASGSGSRSLRHQTSDWGTGDRSPAEILEAVLNNSTLKITRTEGSGKDRKTVTDPEATAKVNEIATKMRERFGTWIWTDAGRAAELAGLYNRRFNNIAPRRFSGEHLTLPGLNIKYKLHPHQKRAIWRVVQTGNTYINHAVGAGKTLEMIVSAMEQRRLGLIRKPMFVVPNHMLDQFSREFLDAYPAANIMVANEKAFHTDNRRRFMAQAALNDLDAIIVTHSSFGKIAPSDDSRSIVLNRMIGELETMLEDLQGQENRISRQKIENQIERLKKRFEGKASKIGKDRTLTFEEMGVDFLYVDEAHEFRKLDFATNRGAVKGINPEGSARALDLYIKTRWLDQQRPGRSLVMASGTPVTNTMAELYTVLRYMDERNLDADGLGHFDAWANQFGQVATAFEQNAAGGYDMVSRFSRFVNVPELMSRVRRTMDVLTMSQLGDLVQRPDLKTGLPINEVVEATPALREYMRDELQERIATARAWKPTRAEPHNPDPLIAIIGDGRLSAIDLRFVKPGAPNDPNSKLNKMIDGIIEKYREFADIEFIDRETGKPERIKGATQIVFSPVGFGEMVAQNRGFDAKAWLMKRLKDAGIPASEVVFMSDLNTHAKKEAAFKDMRQGVKKILIGSPANMGTGVNVQRRLKALHYLSPPWYPSDVEQPHGRIIRQGNANDEVEIYWYATKGTYDSTGWGMVSRKARFIEQAMTGDNTVRKIEDVSEASQYEMASALAAGDERAIKLAGLRGEVERLSRLEGAHADEQSQLRYKRSSLERGIAELETAIENAKKASEALGSDYYRFGITVDGASYDKPGEAGKALVAKLKAEWDGWKVEPPHGSRGIRNEVELGRWHGKFPLVLTRNARVDLVSKKLMRSFDVGLVVGDTGATILSDRLDSGLDPVGLSQRISNAVSNMKHDPARLERVQEENRKELAAVKRRLGAPFEYAGELAEKVAEVAQIETDLAAESDAAQKEAEARRKAQQEEQQGEQQDDQPRPSLGDREPVARLTGEELAPARTVPELRQAAFNWYRDNLSGQSVVMQATGWEVRFNRTGLRKTVNAKGEDLLRMVPALPEIIRNGRVIESAPDRKGRADIAAVHKIAARVELGGVAQDVVATIRETRDGRFHYDLSRDNAAGARSSRGSTVRMDDDAQVRSPALEGGTGTLNLTLLDAGFNDGTEATGPEALRDALAAFESRLRDLGIADRVSVNVEPTLSMLNAQGEPISIDGQYWRRVISVALDASNPAFSFNHEVIHALKGLGLFRAAEWRTLENAARTSARMRGIRRRYADVFTSEADFVEEAIADMYAEWAAGRDQPRGFVRTAFERIRSFLEALRNALTGGGFRTAEDVFAAIERGEIGRREGDAETAGPARPSAAERLAVTATEAFRRWFGDSKVVDENGEPLVVYRGEHGENDLDFHTRLPSISFGSAEAASTYAEDPNDLRDRAEAPRVTPVYLRIQNPIIENRDDPFADMSDLIGKLGREVAQEIAIRHADRIEYTGNWDENFAGEYEGVADLIERAPERLDELYLDAYVLLDDPQFVEAAKAAGYDGAIHIGNGETAGDLEYRIFDPSQAKSVFNRGTFDPNDSRIRFSIGSPMGRNAFEPVSSVIDILTDDNRALIDRIRDAASWDAIGESFDRWRTAFQDQFLPLLRTQARIEEALGRALDEGENPYLGQELMSGRIGAKLERLSEEMVSPLFAAMHEARITVEELESYLYARHAPERNARIASINPKFEEGEGSGMTDAEAAAIMQTAEDSGKKEALEALAAKVDEILDYAVRTRVEAGLLSQAEADAWKATYKHYVPLRGEAEIDPDLSTDRPRRGSGINVRGRESQRAFGRKSAARDILAYSILQAQEAVIRGENNRVAQQFYELAQAAPDEGFWKVDKITKKPVFNKARGVVEYRSEDRIAAEDAPYTVSLKIDGVEHRVTLNRGNAAARRLADSMRNLSAQQLNWMVLTFGKVNRFLSTVNTTLNPEFVITNAFRDLQTAGVNLGQYDAPRLVRNTLRDYPKALAGAMQGAFGRGNGEWRRWYDEFVAEGGRVYFNNMEDISDLRKRVRKDFAEVTPGIKARRAVAGLFRLVENTNMGVENAIRLSAYKNARESGMSKAQAASLAKNLTVNFNRRGTYGPLMNSLYLFYNASIQGTTIMLTAMKSSRVRKVLYAAVATGAMLEILNAMLSGEDDDGELLYDKISEFDKSRNLILMLPGGGGHVKIPLPYGYNVFFALGRSVSRAARGQSLFDIAPDLGETIVDAFNPLGGTNSLMNLVAPTIVDPIVDLERNRDFADRPIMPGENAFGPKTPDHQRYWNSVSPFWRAVTDALNTVSGGDDVKPGAIDVSPETLEYLFGVVTGAAGTFYERTAGFVLKAIDPNQKLATNDIPLARKVIGQKPAWYDRSMFYERTDQIIQSRAYLKGYAERGDSAGAMAYRADNADTLALYKLANKSRSALSDIRRLRGQLDLLRETGRLDAEAHKTRLEALEEREKAIITRFNRTYIERVQRAGE